MRQTDTDAPVFDKTSDEVSDKAVLSILKDASETFILPRYKNLLDTEISTKTSATDFVTVADRQAEAFIAPRLLDLLPDSNCIGEESVAEGRCAIGDIHSPYIWTIDPIDGTRNFVAGGKHFCCMVALIKGDVPVKSWIYRPLVGDCVVASRSKGVSHYLPGGGVAACQPLRRENEVPHLHGTLNAMGLDLSVQDKVRDKLKGLPGRFHLGSAGLDTVYIALGQSDYLMHSKLTPWDSVPVDLTCRELGYFARLVPDAKPFHWQETGILLVASTEAQWHRLAHYIWS